MCQFCTPDHATHWKISDAFDTWLYHRGFFGTKLFLSFLRSKAPVHVNGLESTSMSPLSWGRSAIGNNCQSSNKILCNDRVLWGAESWSDPLCRCLETSPKSKDNHLWLYLFHDSKNSTNLHRKTPPRCAGKHQLKCLRKTFHLFYLEKVWCVILCS